MAEELHTADFFGWTSQQAALLRAGKFQKNALGHLSRPLTKTSGLNNRMQTTQLSTYRFFTTQSPC